MTDCQTCPACKAAEKRARRAERLADKLLGALIALGSPKHVPAVTVHPAKPSAEERMVKATREKVEELQERASEAAIQRMADDIQRARPDISREQAVASARASFQSVPTFAS